MKRVYLSMLLCSSILLLSGCFGGSGDSELQDAINDAKEEIVTGKYEDGICFTDITLGEDEIVFWATVDEEDIGCTLDAIRDNAEACNVMKGVMLENIREGAHDDVEQKSFYNELLRYNKGIKYRLTGNLSGEEMKVTISVKEIQDLIQ